jgi:hypothetical protein
VFRSFAPLAPLAPLALLALLAFTALNPGCTCTPPHENQRDDVGNGAEGEGAASEGEGASTGEGEGASSSEGEGSTSSGEGEGSTSSGEGEGSTSSGEGEGSTGEGEGEGSTSSGEGEGSTSGEGEGSTSTGEGEGEGVDGAGDVWIQIDYSNASTPESPEFTFSNTPGFTGSSWAFDGADFPQAWDRFNDMSVDDDPIGHSLDLSDELQLMIGLHTLTSYDHAVVRLEGRAASVDADTQFDVENPLNGCGVQGVTMSNDWTVHVVDVDLADCLIPGQGVQAVRVSPTNGVPIALVRMRVTLVGAQF